MTTLSCNVHPARPGLLLPAAPTAPIPRPTVRSVRLALTTIYPARASARLCVTVWRARTSVFHPQPAATGCAKPACKTTASLWRCELGELEGDEKNSQLMCILSSDAQRNDQQCRLVRQCGLEDGSQELLGRSGGSGGIAGATRFPFSLLPSPHRLLGSALQSMFSERVLLEGASVRSRGNTTFPHDCIFRSKKPATGSHSAHQAVARLFHPQPPLIDSASQVGLSSRANHVH